MMIDLHNIHKMFGNFAALQGVTCTVPPGSVGLLGPNGAGKSTLIKIILGLQAPSKGTGTVLGQDLLKQTLAIRTEIGYMPEHDCLPLDMKAIDFVTYMGTLVGMPRRDALSRAHEMLGFAGVGDERYRLIRVFSTGQKQLVKFAAAVVHDPALLVLDEPTNGLDHDGRMRMLEMIGQFSRLEGKSVLLSTHLLHDVENICENVIALKDGQVILQGSLRELLTKQDLLQIRIKGSLRRFLGQLVAQGIQFQLVDEGKMVEVLAGDPVIYDQVVDCASRANVQLRFFSVAQRTLDTLFVDAVRGQPGLPAGETALELPAPGGD